MIYTATFNIGVRRYLLDLDTEKADRNYEDEDYMEWFINFPGEVVFDVTMGKLTEKPPFREASMGIYHDMRDYEDGRPAETRIIRLEAKA